MTTAQRTALSNIDAVQAMDKRLGKTRSTTYTRQRGGNITAGDAVTVKGLKGIGARRQLRFVEHVTLRDGREYVTVLDPSTQQYRSCRPDQLSKSRSNGNGSRQA